MCERTLIVFLISFQNNSTATTAMFSVHASFGGSTFVPAMINVILIFSFNTQHLKLRCKVFPFRGQKGRSDILKGKKKSLENKKLSDFYYLLGPDVFSRLRNK